MSLYQSAQNVKKQSDNKPKKRPLEMMDIHWKIDP